MYNDICKHILRGRSEAALRLFKSNLIDIMQAEPKLWTLKAFTKLYGTMQFINDMDPYIRGIIQKRTAQLTSYEYDMEGNPSLMKFVDDNKTSFYDIVYHVTYFGKCLVHLELSLDKANSWDIEIVPPEEYYVLNKDIVFLNDKVFIDKRKFLYFGKELIDFGCTSLSLVPYSVDKETAHRLRMQNLSYINGFLHSKISDEAVKIAEINGESFKDISNSITDKVHDLSYTGGVMNTFDGVAIERVTAGNEGADNPYKSAIDDANEMIEVIILGQAGTTRQGSSGSFAKSKIMFESAVDINDKDIHLFEDVVNRMLNHVKDRLILLEPHLFNVRRAIDTDELQLLQVVAGLSNLNITDVNEKPLTVSVEWLSANFGIPFDNSGTVAFKLSPARINLE